MSAPGGPVLIIGARSDMARAIARAYASIGRPLQLAARNAQSLEADAQDLRLRFRIAVTAHELDVTAIATHKAFLDGLDVLPETVVCAAGLMTQQVEAERDVAAAEAMMRANYIGPALLLGEIAERMVRRASGTIVGISSVAGDRGRASNYVYGSAKAGFTAFLSGLRNRLVRKGVRVITVKPGFVRTRMTEGMKLPRVLTAEPAELAAAILRAERRGRDLIYVRPAWRLIMTIIGLLPEFVFKRTHL